MKLGLIPFFVKACVAALKEHPEVNASIDGDDIVFYSACHIGISVSTPKGLVVPILKNSERLTFAGIEKEIEALAKKAREGALSIDDLRGIQHIFHRNKPILELSSRQRG